VHKDLRARLLGVAVPVAWNVIPQGQSLPAIRLQQISGQIEEHYEGRFEAQMARVQMDCDAISFAASDTIAAAALALIDEPFEQGSTIFNRIFVDSRRDMYEDRDAVIIHRVSIDLMVWHRPK
jgi:hypothetical protein